MGQVFDLKVLEERRAAKNAWQAAALAGWQSVTEQPIDEAVTTIKNLDPSTAQRVIEMLRKLPKGEWGKPFCSRERANAILERIAVVDALTRVS